MERKNNGERGMSLVEVTIILMVLAIVTAVIAPTLGNYVNDARRVKAQEDTEAIGLGLVQMLKDVGKPFPVVDPTVTNTMANRVELLISAGNIPGNTTSDVALDATAGPLAAKNWDGQTSDVRVELMEDHLITNTATYTVAVPTPSTGQIGWRGAYIHKLANGDPWGNRYMANSLYLGWATNATHTDQGWNQDAIVICAGPNGVTETAFDHATGAFTGDDIGMIIYAATR